MYNEFCHIELTTDNPTSAKEFYGSLFSWKFEDAPMEHGTYTMIKPGSGPGGGIMAKPMPNAPTMWLSYVKVESVDATVEKATKMKGKVIVPKTPIPNMGHFAVLQDPTGGVFGIWAEK